MVSDLPTVGKSFSIEGQAGQGKTQLAIQFLQDIQRPFLWFQLSRDEIDPVLLLAELLDGLQASLPDFSSPNLVTWREQGSPVPSDWSKLTAILLDDLEDHLTSDFYMVLDDLHMLDGHVQSLNLIGSLLNVQRSKIHFIFISRHPVAQLLNFEQRSLALQRLGNNDLALNRQEIAELFNAYLKIPVSSSTVSNLYQANEGWIMGLVLAAQGGNGRDLQTSAVKAYKNLSRDAFLDYFSSEVLQKLSEELQGDLISLSLLDEIPSDLAMTITGRQNIAEQLNSLEQKNFFVRSTGKKDKIFRLHHLFQESLNHVARDQMGKESFYAIWNAAGDWYCEKSPETALSYFIRACNYSESQAVLGDLGMELVIGNRLVTLERFLAQIPDDVLHDYPWLPFYKGIVCLNFEPPGALRPLETALQGFVRENNEFGELVTLIQMIYFHTAVDCQFSKGRNLLERAIALYEKHGQELDESQRAHAANIFVLGLTFFSAELERAKSYADLGLAKAQKLGLKGLEAEARLARCYRDLFAGNLHSCRHEIEQSRPLLKDPQVNLIHKAALHLAQLNLLVNEGDGKNYEYHRQIFRKTYGETLVDQSSFGAIMRMWEMDLALAAGNEAEVEDILKAALASPFGSSLAHMRSLYLQYKAFLRARQGNLEESMNILNESFELREQTGGPEFEIMNAVLLGGTYARLGLHENALNLFSAGLAISEAAEEYFVRPGIYAHRAWLYLKLDSQGEACDDLERMLACLQETGFRSFYGCDPVILEDLLSLAARQSIQLDLVTEFAADRLCITIDARGRFHPLVHFRCLGNLEIWCGSNQLFNADLSPIMRNLFALLLAAPNHQLDQEQIQNALWPDEQPRRSRANLDSLILRIRKLLDQSFPEVSAREILSLKKQVVCLEYCWFDIDKFRELIKEGLSQSRRKQTWLAGNALREGLDLWQGEFLGGGLSELELGQISSNLFLSFLEASSEYGRLLALDGELAEACKVIEKAIHYDPTNEALVRQLYDLQIQQDMPQRAHLVFQNYAKALKKEDFSAEDIEFLLENFFH